MHLIIKVEAGKKAEYDKLTLSKFSSLKQAAMTFYELDWLDSKPQIEQNQHKKIVTYQDGSRYEGSLQGQDKHGIGIMQEKSGEKYWGEWQNDKQQGRGSFVSPAVEYVGQWVNGHMEG